MKISSLAFKLGSKECKKKQGKKGNFFMRVTQWFSDEHCCLPNKNVLDSIQEDRSQAWGLSMWSLHVPTIFMWAPSGCSGLLPLSKDMHLG